MICADDCCRKWQQHRFGQIHAGEEAARQAPQDLSQNLVPSVCSIQRPQHVALAVGLNAQGQIDGLVADHAVVADLDPQRVEEDDRIHRLKWTALPAQRLGHHLVGDRADEVGRHLGAVVLSRKPVDLAHAHAAGVHRNDAFVEAGETAFVLGNQVRLEAAVTVAGDFAPNRAAIGNDRLAAGAVALVSWPGGLGWSGG